MMRRTIVFLALTCSALGAGCDGDGVSEPPLTRLELMPAKAALFAGPPENTVQLTVQAYDRRGQPILDPGVATYTSSDPSIAQVSGSGLVSAVAPGTAEITAVVSRNGLAQTVSMSVTVGWVAVNGSYDLTATIDDSDPAWGDLFGFRYTAVITLLHDARYAPGIGGTFWDLRLTSPDGHETPVGNGVITSHFDWKGQVVIRLGSNYVLVPAGELVAPVIEGTFGAGGHIAGPFTASGEEPGRAAGMITWLEAAWHPAAIDVAAGETVMWLLGDLTGDPTEIWIGDTALPLIHGRAEHVFSTPGEYWYCVSGCWDYGWGLVRVAPAGSP
jgi:plastocyanin